MMLLYNSFRSTIWSRLLQKGKLDEAKIAQALAIIERNAKLQAELIEDLLDVSRILRGKLSLNVSPVNLASMIKAALETVRLAAEAKSITVEVNLAPNVKPVSGDQPACSKWYGICCPTLLNSLPQAVGLRCD
jgi:signal transduction histidine kinase